MRRRAVESTSRPVVKKIGVTRRLVGLTTRFLVLALAVLLTQNVMACSVCYGAPGDPLVKGANNGIMFLLAIVGLVQIGFIAMFWSFWRKAREQRRFRESLRVIEGGPRP